MAFNISHILAIVLYLYLFTSGNSGVQGQTMYRVDYSVKIEWERSMYITAVMFLNTTGMAVDLLPLKVLKIQRTYDNSLKNSMETIDIKNFTCAYCDRAVADGFYFVFNWHENNEYPTFYNFTCDGIHVLGMALFQTTGETISIKTIPSKHPCQYAYNIDEHFYLEVFINTSLAVKEKLYIIGLKGMYEINAVCAIINETTACKGERIGACGYCLEKNKDGYKLLIKYYSYYQGPESQIRCVVNNLYSDWTLLTLYGNLFLLSRMRAEMTFLMGDAARKSELMSIAYKLYTWSNTYPNASVVVDNTTSIQLSDGVNYAEFVTTSPDNVQHINLLVDFSDCLKVEYSCPMLNLSLCKDPSAETGVDYLTVNFTCVENVAYIQRRIDLWENPITWEEMKSGRLFTWRINRNTWPLGDGTSFNLTFIIALPAHMCTEVKYYWTETKNPLTLAPDCPSKVNMINGHIQLASNATCTCISLSIDSDVKTYVQWLNDKGQSFGTPDTKVTINIFPEFYAGTIAHFTCISVYMHIYGSSVMFKPTVYSKISFGLSPDCPSGKNVTNGHIELGSNATCTCITLSDAPDVNTLAQWFDDKGNTVGPADTNVTLQIISEYYDQNATFTCRYINASFDGDVLVFKPKFYRTPLALNFTVNGSLSVDVVKSETIHLFCHVTGVPPAAAVITGSRLGRIKERTSDADVLEIVLPGVECEDSGRYFCWGDNGFQTNQTKVQTYVDVNVICPIKVAEEPNTVHNVQISPDVDTVFTFEIYGYPEPTEFGLKIETGESTSDVNADKYNIFYTRLTPPFGLITLTIYDKNTRGTTTYIVSVRNKVGELTFKLDVVKQSPNLTSQSDASLPTTVAMGIGIGAGGVVLIVIAVIVVTVRCRGRCCENQANTDDLSRRLNIQSYLEIRQGETNNEINQYELVAPYNNIRECRPTFDDDYIHPLPDY